MTTDQQHIAMFTPIGIPAFPIQVLAPTQAANDPQYAA